VLVGMCLCFRLMAGGFLMEIVRRVCVFLNDEEGNGRGVGSEKLHILPLCECQRKNVSLGDWSAPICAYD